MHSYTFVIKKENMVFEFTTDSKDFIDKEFEKWIISLSKKEPQSKTKKQAEKPKENPVIKEVLIELPADKKVEPEPILPSDIESEASAMIEEKIEAVSKEEGKQQDVINEGDLLVQETTSAFQKLSRKLSVENFDTSSQEPVGDFSKELKSKIEVAIKNEPISKSEVIQEDIVIDYASPSIDGDTDLVELEEIDFSDSEFDAIFQEKMNSDVEEYSAKKDTKFLDFQQGKNCQSPIDKFILIAKYLLDVENKERFVMKDIMDIASEHSIKQIDYALITKAVSLKVVKVVPDLTGVADVVEYALTPKGEDYFNV